MKLESILAITSHQLLVNENNRKCNQYIRYVYDSDNKVFELSQDLKTLTPSPSSLSFNFFCNTSLSFLRNCSHTLAVFLYSLSVATEKQLFLINNTEKVDAQLGDFYQYCIFASGNTHFI